MNPYDYERIGFLLEQLKLLGSEEWSPTEVCVTLEILSLQKLVSANFKIPLNLFLQNLLLLNHLKQYTRVSTPSHCELQFYQHHLACFTNTDSSLTVDDQKLPVESKSRLPFHALLEESAAESIIS